MHALILTAVSAVLIFGSAALIAAIDRHAAKAPAEPAPGIRED